MTLGLHLDNLKYRTGGQDLMLSASSAENQCTSGTGLSAETTCQGEANSKHVAKDGMGNDT